MALVDKGAPPGTTVPRSEPADPAVVRAMGPAEAVARVEGLRREAHRLLSWGEAGGACALLRSACDVAKAAGMGPGVLLEYAEVLGSTGHAASAAFWEARHGTLAGETPPRPVTAEAFSRVPRQDWTWLGRDGSYRRPARCYPSGWEWSGVLGGRSETLLDGDGREVARVDRGGTETEVTIMGRTWVYVPDPVVPAGPYADAVRALGVEAALAGELGVFDAATAAVPAARGGDRGRRHLGRQGASRREGTPLDGAATPVARARTVEDCHGR